MKKTFKINEWKVRQEESGERLSTYIQQKTGMRYSIRGIKRALERGLCRINGKPEKYGSVRVKTNDLVVFLPEKTVIEASHFTIDESVILYEDKTLIALNKPQGFSSLRTQSGNVGIFEEFKKFFESHRKKDDLHLLHRLDKDTSGVLMIAKSEIIKKEMIEQFRNHEVQKKYLTLVEGIPKEIKGTINRPLVLEKKEKGYEKWKTGLKGKDALTRYKILFSFRDFALLEVELLTGRTHQIRVHLASIGNPVIGDLVYGRAPNERKGLPFHMLHAWQFSFIHPLTTERVTVKAPLPENWKVFLGDKMKLFNDKREENF